ncbi:MAG TPA: pepsin-like aspartic protease [Terracidiphilus sp.]|nr:pepsin-like aspartic protease [Terracidiphilus sp.]
MSAKTIRMPITNIIMDGDYTGEIQVGSQKTPCNVILDTGSSTLAIDGTHYDVSKDKSSKVTDIAQEVGYADGSSWVGGVITTDVVAGTGSNSASLPQVHVAIAYHETKTMFGNTDGILGLAYTKLNNGFTMPGPTIPPKYTYNEIQAGKVAYVDPYFSQLEAAGLVANKFAFYTRRSMVNLATANPKTDPMNKGFLILGGGEENTDLYSGPFQVARVVDDLYYNTNLKSVIVGKSAPIAVSPPTKASGNQSNSIVDSGTNCLVLVQSLFDQIAQNLSAAGDPSLTDAIRAGYIPMSQLNLSKWPPITFVLEGALGTDVKLAVSPSTYWQTNSPKAGFAQAVLYGDSGQGGGVSILGLPLLNNYFTVFDRSVDKGLGVVSFARIK